MPPLIIEKLHPKQILFCKANTKYVCYGGARGGGKTHVVRVKSVSMARKYPGIKILIVRKTFPQLSESFALPLIGMLRPAGLAKYNGDERRFTFVNGSTIKLGYCDNDADSLNYKGLEYDVIFIDEATEISEYSFTNISLSCRGVNEFPKRVYLTCNPGGIGHEWVKRLFIERNYRPTEDPNDYTFIQAKASDNYSLADKDPAYLKALDSLPEKQRAAWRDGSWDVYVGQFFDEFSEHIHVIKPFVIPDHWRRYVSIDYGYTDMCAVLWFAINEKGQIFVYRELYESKLVPSRAAEKILQMTGSEKIDSFFAPPDLYSNKNDGGRSTAEQFGENGIYFSMASNKRADGWIAVKEQLQIIDTPDGGKTSNLKIFTNCINLIRCMPKLQYDTEKLDGDVLKQPHEFTHAPDALRYFCISHKANASELPGKISKSPFKFTLPSSEPSLIGIGDKIIPV